MSGHISESIYGLLMRQGLRAETAGTVKARGNKRRAAASDGAVSQVAAAKPGSTAQEGCSGVRLKLVVSNKDVRRRDPTSVAPLGLRTSLVLVN